MAITHGVRQRTEQRIVLNEENRLPGVVRKNEEPCFFQARLLTRDILGRVMWTGW